MGSPVFSAIVEAVLQRLEDTSKSSYRPLFWTHYDDDAFDIIEPEKLTSFQSALNSVYQRHPAHYGRRENARATFSGCLDPPEKFRPTFTGKQYTGIVFCTSKATMR